MDSCSGHQEGSGEHQPDTDDNLGVSADWLKQLACEAIDSQADQLEAVSAAIWGTPELKFEEHHAHQVLTDFLEKNNFPVERHYVLDTAFRVVYGDVRSANNDVTLPNMAVLCEYDALPEIGHACGHNLIAECGVGAAIGVKAALDAAATAGRQLGQLTVLGTPGEEGGGGKVYLIRQGAFDTVDGAVLSHPFPASAVTMNTLARYKFTATYHGKASHAAAFPWEGVNALDAAVMAYTSISVLRQQIKPECRVHGIFTNGGEKPNIIPEEAELHYFIRAPTTEILNRLKHKITNCLEGAAIATGCTVDIVWGDIPYENLISNRTLAELYERNAVTLGVDTWENRSLGEGVVASTDMGNVSHLVPSLHPVYCIGSPVLNHTRPFTAAAGSAEAQPRTLNQAKLLAMCMIDVYLKPDLVKRMKTEMEEDLQREGAQ